MRLVIKIGGSLIKEGLLDNILHDLALLYRRHEIILVHGGADIVTHISEKLGKEPKFITSPSGIRSRYTDEETARIYTMVMSGMIAPQIALGLNKLGIKSVSVAGYDGSLISAERKKKLIIMDERGRKVVIEGGYTGKVSNVNKPLLETFLTLGLIPIVSPVAISEQSDLLNIDSDRAASAIAASVGASKLILLSNVDGLIIEGHLVRHLSPSQAKELLQLIGAGMDKKVIAATEAVEKGVERAIISSGRIDKPVLNALEELCGTVIAVG
jgi:acetylglutamate kinase